MSAKPIRDGRTEHATTVGLDFYTQPSAMTSLGHHAALLSELPNEVADLVRIIQNLVVYDVVAPNFTGSPFQNGVRARFTFVHCRRCWTGFSLSMTGRFRPGAP